MVLQSYRFLVRILQAFREVRSIHSAFDTFLPYYGTVKLLSDSDVAGRLAFIIALLSGLTSSIAQHRISIC